VTWNDVPRWITEYVFDNQFRRKKFTFPTAQDTGRISITFVNSVTAPERRHDQSAKLQLQLKDCPIFLLTT
jgi:hypothetical protein